MNRPHSPDRRVAGALAPGGMGLRVLKLLTIVMGVTIVAGTGTLVAVIAHRMAVPAADRVAEAAAGVPVAVPLDEPAGTRIAGVAAVGDRLAVQLQGGGADRVVLVDPRSGAVAGRITLGR